MSKPPELSDATPDRAGRPCPYCQTVVAIGDGAARCADCTAVHHAECWEENEGCSIPGCASAPDPTQASVAAPVPDPGPVTTSRLAIALDASGEGAVTGQREVLSAAPVGLPAPRRRRPMRIALITVLVLVIVGGILIVLLSPKPTTAGASGVCRELGGVPAATTPGQGSSGSPADALSGSTPAAEVTVEELQRLVSTYLQAIHDGDREQAFRCIAPGYRTALAPGSTDLAVNVDWWWARQEALRDGLPDRPRVTITGRVLPLTGTGTTVRFRVGTVALVEPRCTYVEGPMWARYIEQVDGGEWRLEPAFPGQRSEPAVSRLDREDGITSFYAPPRRTSPCSTGAA